MTTPVCDDFLVAAIKHERLKPPNIIPSTAWAAFPMRFLFNVALELYTPKEIVAALNRLIAKGVILAVDHGVENSGPSLMKKLLPKIELYITKDSRRWRLTEEGKVAPIDYQGKTIQKFFPQLYVAADGIPDSLKRALEVAKRKEKPKALKKVKKTKAQLIIDSMQG